ncbi:MAG: HU family DNA-binding protein [Prevotellaceae bacterium]|jgi:predicted histone-like DNA-binding protein|nr:HU family DNA-binding protein [Prevotellaceae bacterium]
MSIFYNKVERGNPQDKTAAKKWYPSLKSVRLVGEKEVAKLVADETTLNRKEVEMALDQFQKILLRLLLDSNSVKLGDWGTFRLTCTGEGATTAPELTAKNIKDLHLRFTPGAEIRNTLLGATFLPAESVLSGKK